MDNSIFLYVAVLIGLIIIGAKKGCDKGSSKHKTFWRVTMILSIILALPLLAVLSLGLIMNASGIVNPMTAV
ncbi:hypothetical protein V8G56_06405 [Gaetbulibacter aquiaggeris]|uniref:Uncharacterized protein n=1 Tax=Gaetbulibacter aquiaggeris TaxID=1735373 RepID=A0ABW7MP08_9FLAO